MSAYKKILIAVDVCDDYQEVIKKAMKLADDPEWLHVVHVVEPIYYPENYMGGTAIDFQEKTVEFAKSELDEIATKHAIPPVLLISETTFSPASLFISTITTLAPSLLNLNAVAFPMPFDPPVITATLSFNKLFIS